MYPISYEYGDGITSFVKIIYLLKENVESTASKNYVTNFCKLLTLHETKRFNEKTNNKLNNENHLVTRKKQQTQVKILNFLNDKM